MCVLWFTRRRILFNYTIISDKNNEERRNLVYSEFNKLGVKELRFTDAIMATKMTDEEVYSNTIPNTFLSKGEVGCALSHKKVYEEFLSSNQKSIAIFEDDIIFLEECSTEVIQAIMDIVDTMTEPTVVALQKSVYHNEKKIDISEDISIYSSRNLFCMHGYILNRAAAKNILKIQTPIRFEIDAFKFYYWLGELELFCLNKDLVVQSLELESNIGSIRYEVDNRTELKNNAYKDLYYQLPLKEKLKAQIKRLNKAIHKPFESLDY